VKLSYRKKQLGVTLPSVIIEEMSEMSKNYLTQMWRDGKCETVEKVCLEAQRRFDSQKFNFKTIG
jgi:hypothetical protein